MCQAYPEVSFAGEPRSNKVCARRTAASAEGVGAQLARDLARSGSKTCARGVSDEPRKSGSGPLRSPSSATERRPARLPRPAGRRGDLADQPISVGARLAREAEHSVCQVYREVSFAGEPRSNKVYARRDAASAEGVGAQLARDLARSGSKTCPRGVSDEPRKFGFRAAQRPIVGNGTPPGQTSTPCGQTRHRGAHKTCWNEACPRS